MGYWITMRRQTERTGFSAATAHDALEMVDAKLADGWDEVRIIDSDGTETNAYSSRIAVAGVEAGRVDNREFRLRARHRFPRHPPECASTVVALLNKRLQSLSREKWGVAPINAIQQARRTHYRSGNCRSAMAENQTRSEQYGCRSIVDDA